MTEGLNILFLGTLAVLACGDFRRQRIPNGGIFLILILALAAGIFTGELTISERLIGGIGGSLPCLLLGVLLPGSFGGGDIKLIAACGFFMGWKRLIVAVVLAVFLGGLFSLYLLGSRKGDLKRGIPFSPFIAVGMMISVLWGEQLITWYL